MAPYFDAQSIQIIAGQVRRLEMELAQLRRQAAAGRFELDDVPLRPVCRFRLDAAMASSDASAAATIDIQIGFGRDHASDSITVWNMPRNGAGSTYEYYGDADYYGMADWDPVREKWWIRPMECP